MALSRVLTLAHGPLILKSWVVTRLVELHLQIQLKKLTRHVGDNLFLIPAPVRKACPSHKRNHNFQSLPEKTIRLAKRNNNASCAFCFIYVALKRNWVTKSRVEMPNGSSLSRRSHHHCSCFDSSWECSWSDWRDTNLQVKRKWLNMFGVVSEKIPKKSGKFGDLLLIVSKHCDGSTEIQVIDNSHTLSGSVHWTAKNKAGHTLEKVDPYKIREDNRVIDHIQTAE